MLSPHARTRHYQHHGRASLLTEDISRRIAPPVYCPYKSIDIRCMADVHGEGCHDDSHPAGASPPLPAARYAVIGAGIAGLATAWNLIVR